LIKLTPWKTFSFKAQMTLRLLSKVIFFCKSSQKAWCFCLHICLEMQKRGFICWEFLRVCSKEKNDKKVCFKYPFDIKGSKTSNETSFDIFHLYRFARSHLNGMFWLPKSDKMTKTKQLLFVRCKTPKNPLKSLFIASVHLCVRCF
jgi:hypothetical protein